MRNQDSWFVEGILEDAGWGTRRISTSGLKAILSGPTAQLRCGKVSAVCGFSDESLTRVTVIQSCSVQLLMILRCTWTSLHEFCSMTWRSIKCSDSVTTRVSLQIGEVGHMYHLKHMIFEDHLAMFSNTAKSFPSFSVILCSVVESLSSKASPCK